MTRAGEVPSERILLAHGAGGRMAHELIARQFLPFLLNPMLSPLDDSAILPMEGARFAFTTDSYVVDPLFFPGGDIGRLAVCGTVNDLAMGGAVPLYLSLSLIIEEGFMLEELKRILSSVREAAQEAQVLVVTGDTKVVGRGGADKIFLNTAGIGILPKEQIHISGGNAQVGDRVILSGSIGEHGIAVLSKREGIFLGEETESDVAPLNGLVQGMLQASHQVHVLRDPTRGGLASALNEIAEHSQVGIVIEESKIPVRESVQGACELLGLDPLYIANEGKLVAIVKKEASSKILRAMRRNPLGRDAEVIGEVVADPRGMVLLKTRIGGTRVLDMLSGEPLPRIC
ncbi:MAG: hydrogenase expression/formation protein HypE [candidate division NC10 bacterium]|nr:hydrogenase expression/formation protein HypE [candidate division NC10 bacterium]